MVIGDISLIQVEEATPLHVRIESASEIWKSAMEQLLPGLAPLWFRLPDDTLCVHDWVCISYLFES